MQKYNLTSDLLEKTILDIHLRNHNQQVQFIVVDRRYNSNIRKFGAEHFQPESDGSLCRQGILGYIFGITIICFNKIESSDLFFVSRSLEYCGMLANLEDITYYCIDIPPKTKIKNENIFIHSYNLAQDKITTFV